MLLSDLQVALADLELRVEDWKGHNIGSFGRLLLYGELSVKHEGISQRTGQQHGTYNVSIVNLHTIDARL
jgi:hypothetical protein